MTLGDRIHYLRTQSNITMEELADKIGVQKGAIHKYEKGLVTNIPTNRLRLLADALNTTTTYLLEGKSGLIVSDKTPYNPFYDEDNDAYGDDIEWRKMHGAIDENENLRRIVTMCVGLDDATLKQIAAVIEVLINNGQKT